MSALARTGAIVAVVAVGSWSAATGGGGAVEPDACEYGITLALIGRPAAAESVFVSLLSRSPRDARALTNLGNLALLRGDAALALAYYDRAAAADSADAGILLNAATALLVAGEEEAASAEAAVGVRRAGGVRGAARLLGIRAHGEEPAATKAGSQAYVSREEVLGLLRAAAGRVPKDSLGVGGGGAREAPAPGGRRVRQWRSAGARAARAPDPATLVYWKR